MNHPTLLASAIIASYAAWYLILCVVAPYGTCSRCNGIGRQATTGRRRLRDCPRCNGTGRRVRLGRRAYTHLHHTRAGSTR